MSGRNETPVLADQLAVPLLFLVVTLAIVLGLDMNEHFFLRDDFLNYYLGAYSEIARAIKAGEFPLLTLTSWQAGALAGEYQFGLFSPVLLVTNLLLFDLDLPLHHLAAALVWIHVLILSGGAYLLARSRDLTPEFSLMVALASSLNGWMAIWGINWFAALASFAWLPWSWWALERSICRGGELRYVVAGGVFIGLAITAGFPYTCFMIFCVAAASAGRLLVAKRPFRETLPVLWSVLIGFGLSSPSWLMLIEYSGSTMRSQTTRPLIFQTDLMVPLEAWLGTILPTLKAAWSAPWLPPENTTSVVMHIGLAPVVLLVAAGISLRSKLLRSLKYDFLFVSFLFLLATLPSIGVFRWSFRWLPLFFLQLSLIAGSAAMVHRASDAPHQKYGKVAWLLVAAVCTYAILCGDHEMGTLLLPAGLLAVASSWWALESLSRSNWIHLQLPWLVIPVTSFLVFGLTLANYPSMQRHLEPRANLVFDRSITYLALYTMEDTRRAPLVFPGQRFFPANEHMHSGLRFVNGYSPLGPAGTTRAFGLNYLGALWEDPLPPMTVKPLGPLLQRMAVDGIVVWPGTRQQRNIPFEEFEKHASPLPGVDIYHRRGTRSPRAQIVRQATLVDWTTKMWHDAPSPQPPLETPGRRIRAPQPATFGDAQLTVLAEDRHRMRVEVDARESRQPVLVSFARQWLPGYRVAVDGKPAPLLRLDHLLPAVEVPGGQVSRVDLTYRPTSFIVGCVLVVSTLTAILYFLIRSSGRRAT